MSSRPVGKCVNFRQCPKADGREAIPVAARNANPVCPNCSQALLVTTPVVNPRRNAFVAVVIVAVLLFVGLGLVLRHDLTGGSIARVAIPTPAAAPALAVAGSPSAVASAPAPVASAPVAVASGRVKKTSQGNVNRVGFAGTDTERPPQSRTSTVPVDAPPAYADLLRTADKVDFTLYFKPDSEIPDNDANAMGHLVSLLKSDGYRARKVVAAGFADKTGEPGYSRLLSAKRAQNVAAVLASQGVAVAQTFGFGQVVPVGDNATREGREKNRRVEIFVAR
jgi:outer membrane protein OmpA-like peptidoglycan-associated protein